MPSKRGSKREGKQAGAELCPARAEVDLPAGHSRYARRLII